MCKTGEPALAGSSRWGKGDSGGAPPIFEGNMENRIKRLQKIFEAFEKMLSIMDRERSEGWREIVNSTARRPKKRQKRRG